MREVFIVPFSQVSGFLAKFVLTADSFKKGV